MPRPKFQELDDISHVLLQSLDGRHETKRAKIAKGGLWGRPRYSILLVTTANYAAC